MSNKTKRAMAQNEAKPNGTEQNTVKLSKLQQNKAQHNKRR